MRLFTCTKDFLRLGQAFYGLSRELHALFGPLLRRGEKGSECFLFFSKNKFKTLVNTFLWTYY